ncbi:MULTISPECIES: hypothetical protein [unclassified Marinobacter]|uniref:hypothetical protein n=1 Tax=unclassified Marinobacter TaxID=83889 RepID=UPI001267B6D7|nr:MULTISPECIES: hypothetical protein [unclassified Marinobacter]QFS88981.1 hypothetical protein FIV08_19230 [Marinobacter sp. THAF197a]QFT52766.1 hypothetical protein FIU96_19135 [Marinobacter sp. THAF39]
MLPLRSALAYVALLSAVLATLPGMAFLGAVAVSLAVSLGWQDMRRVPRAVFAVAVLAMAFAFGRDPGLVEGAAGNMTRLAGLILSVMLLSSVLAGSRDLQRISSSLFSGKPGTRYASLAFGTALVSVPLNFGSVAVVGSLISERIRRSGDSAATRNSTRAVLRGFGVSPIWSPLSISVALTLTLLPTLGGAQLIGLSLPFAMLVLLAGFLWREPEPQPETGVAADTAGAAAWLRFGGIILGICIGVFLFSHVYEFSYARSVTLSCLTAVIISWALSLAGGHRPRPPTMANVSNELAIVGGSAFIGSVISAVVLGQVDGDMGLPGWAWPVLAALVPWSFFLAGLAGANPILTGTLIGGILGPAWPLGAALGLGFAMVTGWGITAFGTPFAANALIMERLTGYRARDASLQWSLALSLIALSAASAIAAGLTVWLA